MVLALPSWPKQSFFSELERPTSSLRNRPCITALSFACFLEYGPNTCEVRPCTQTAWTRPFMSSCIAIVHMDAPTTPKRSDSMDAGHSGTLFAVTTASVRTAPNGIVPSRFPFPVLTANDIERGPMMCDFNCFSFDFAHLCAILSFFPSKQHTRGLSSGLDGRSYIENAEGGGFGYKASFRSTIHNRPKSHISRNRPKAGCSPSIPVSQSPNFP